MKVLYFSDSRVPSSGADSVHVMKMCNALSAEGNDVTLVCYQEEHTGSPFERYALEPSFKLQWYNEIKLSGARRIVRMLDVLFNRAQFKDADVIYGRDIYSLALNASLGLPVLFEAHAPPLSALQHQFIKWLMGRRNFARLVVISEPLRQEYQRLFPNFDPARILVAHDAADPMLVDPPAQIEPWPGRSDACQIGYVGSLHPGKGGEIIDQLAEAMPQHDFHVVGNAPDDRIKLRPSPNLHCHGRIDHKDVADYLSMFDILLFPGQDKVIMRDGWDIGRWTSPMKIFEYMSARRCIVASKTHATHDLLCHGETACLVPPTDISCWTKAINELASDPDKRERLATAAFKRWEVAHTWRQRAKDVLDNLDG